MDFSVIKERLLDRYEISKQQLNGLRVKTLEITERAKIWKTYKPLEKQRHIDDFLFTPDELPIFGKEYWFFLLTGTGESHKDQLMVSFGRNKNNTMRINDQDQLKDTEEYHGGIGEVWYYLSGVTTRLGKLGGKIFNKSQSIVFESNEYTVEFSGIFPNYRLIVTAKDQTIITIGTKEPQIGDSMEFFSIDKFNMGVEVGNVYLDFEGISDSINFNGRCYMQKVIMSAPFIPWFWGRFNFPNGSVLVFFLLWVDLPGPDRVIYSQGKYFDVEKHEYKVFKKFTVKKVIGTNYFILEHDSVNLNVFLLMDSYTNNTFSMKAHGEFRYNEMFTEVREIRIRDGNRILDTEYFGKGAGSLEEATGMSL